MKKIFKTSELKDATILAEFKGEKILLRGMDCFYVAPKQVGVEKAIPLPLEEGIRVAKKLQARKESLH